ncbi:MAG: hypothetical protein AAFR91_08085 [Pseudomonadota bacterium]
MIAAVAGVSGLTACDVEQTREGEMPTVDVDYEEGQLPEYEVTKTQDGKMPSISVDADAGQLPAYDIDTVDVSVGTTETKVSVPDVEVSMEERTVSVPDVDIEMPEDDEPNDSGK